MARRGSFGTGGQGGSVAGSVIKNILQMQGTGTEETPAPEASAPRTRKPMREFTAEEIAKNPVLSGKLSLDQAKINWLKYQDALNKMPLATTTGKKYDRQLKAAQQALAKLGGDPSVAERQFYALGGKMADTKQGGGAGWSENQILDYWRAAGMEDKGYDIVAKIRGYDRFGNPVEGGLANNTINYTLGKNYTTKVQSDIKNLTPVQAAKITKLRNLKQSGATLTPRQQAALKRLRALKNG